MAPNLFFSIIWLFGVSWRSWGIMGGVAFFQKIGVPQNGWFFLMENPIQIGWFGGNCHHVLETFIWGVKEIKCASPRICLDRTTTRRLPLQQSWPLVPKHPRPPPAGGDKVASISGAGFWDFGKEIWTLWSFSIFSSSFLFPNKKSTKFWSDFGSKTTWNSSVRLIRTDGHVDRFEGCQLLKRWRAVLCSVSNNFRTFWLNIANVWIFAWKNMWIIHCALTKLTGFNV